MADAKNEFPTILASDASFKGDLTFEKGVRVEGSFEGKINSKGSLYIGEGAKITADIEANNVTIEGQCKGNLVVSEKLRLLATARVDGDLRTNRLEIADGAIFVGKVVVGQASSDPVKPRGAEGSNEAQPASVSRDAARVGQPSVAPGGPQRSRPQEARVPSAS